jgi:hypothetical protein
VWGEEEYKKLPTFDGPTWSQPGMLFICHQNDRDDEDVRVCAGWAGCHDMDQSLGLRIAAASGEVSPETAQAIYDYESPVPLFSSGAEAAEHGMREIENPSPEAAAMSQKIARTRTDVRWG